MKNRVLHSTFSNKDYSFNTDCRSMKLLAVVLRSILEGSVSHFFDIGLSYFSMLFRKKMIIIFYSILHFTS